MPNHNLSPQRIRSGDLTWIDGIPWLITLPRAEWVPSVVSNSYHYITKSLWSGELETSSMVLCRDLGNKGEVKAIGAGAALESGVVFRFSPDYRNRNYCFQPIFVPIDLDTLSVDYRILQGMEDGEPAQLGCFLRYNAYEGEMLRRNQRAFSHIRGYRYAFGAYSLDGSHSIPVVKVCEGFLAQSPLIRAVSFQALRGLGFVRSFSGSI